MKEVNNRVDVEIDNAFVREGKDYWRVEVYDEDKNRYTYITKSDRIPRIRSRFEQMELEDIKEEFTFRATVKEVTREYEEYGYCNYEVQYAKLIPKRSEQE